MRTRAKYIQKKKPSETVKYQELKEIIDDLKKDRRKKLVEGKKDKEALNKLGIKQIETINTKPLREITRKENEKEVILLTDFDREGKSKSSQLIRLYRAEGIKTDLNYKKQLGKLHGISEIEEIPTKYKELKNKK